MADPTEHGIPRAVAIAWGMVETPQRGPSRGMTHQQIVDAGIEIADAGGLTAVTMQRVAESLGFTTMSLYRYVSSKDDLLLLMQDAATQLPASAGAPEGGWQAGIRQLANELREIYRARPWLLELPRNQTTLLMPNSMAVVDRALSVMEPLRLDMAQKVAVILNISVMAIAYAQLEQELSASSRVVLDPAGLAQLTDAIGPERFPALAPLQQSGEWIGGEYADAQTDVEAELALGLEWIIAGIERLDAAAGGAAHG